MIDLHWKRKVVDSIAKARSDKGLTAIELSYLAMTEWLIANKYMECDHSTPQFKLLDDGRTRKICKACGQPQGLFVCNHKGARVEGVNPRCPTCGVVITPTELKKMDETKEA